MEENKKKVTGKFGRFFGWIISMALLFALAVGIVQCYPKITEGARKIYSQDPIELQEESARRYTAEVAGLMCGMYIDWCYEVYSTWAEPGTILLGIERNVQGIYKNRYPDFYEVEAFWYQNDYRTGLEQFDLEYYLVRESAGEEVHDCGTLSVEAALADAEKYPFMVRVLFDEKGFPTVISERGSIDAQDYFNNAYSDWVLLRQMYLDESDLENTEVAFANMTLTIASQSNVYLNVYDNYQYKTETFWNCWHEMMHLNYPLFVFGAIGIVLLLGLILPAIRPLGLKEGWKANLWLEFIVVAFTCLLGLVLEVIPRFLLQTQMQIDFPGTVFYWYGIFEEIMVGETEVIFLRAIHVAIWFFVFLGMYLCAISMRQVFTKGFFRYCKENTLVGRTFCWIGRKIKAMINYVGEIDFKEEGTKKLILLVGINFVIVSLCSCIWFFGIFGAALYSGLLFVLIQKKWKEIRAQYEALLQTTEEMATGELDVEYLGEAGAFYELQGALKQVQSGFSTAVQKEVKSERMRTELITNVSHDLKTPLTAIITYVDLLKKEDITAEERQNYVGVLEQKSARLKTLIENLFEVSKASSGNIQLEKVQLDLGQLLQEVQLELENEIMKSGIEFKLNLPEEKVMLSLDAAKTSRIFENLMINITKYGLTGSRAYIQLEQDEKEVRVAMRNVSATEIGFDSEEIMERFTRGDESRNTEGSGLGLAIVKSFVEAQGGKVEIQLEDDLFRVTVIFFK